MSVDHNILTAEDMFWKMEISGPIEHAVSMDDAIEYAKAYGRQVAKQVMQECANKAQVSYMACGDQMNCGCQGHCEHPTAGINRVALLLIDTEQFIK